MQKNLPLVIAISGCLLSLAALGAPFLKSPTGSGRVVYLNTDKLLNSYQAMVSARREYQREKQEWTQNLRTLTEEAQQATRHNQGAPGNTLAQQEARLKQRQLLNYRQAILQQDQTEMQRLTQPVVTAANRFIAAYSRAHHYDLVLAAAGQGDVVYAAPALDITQKVTIALNQQLADSLARTSGRKAQP